MTQLTHHPMRWEPFPPSRPAVRKQQLREVRCLAQDHTALGWSRGWCVVCTPGCTTRPASPPEPVPFPHAPGGAGGGLPPASLPFPGRHCRATAPRGQDERRPPSQPIRTVGAGATPDPRLPAGAAVLSPEAKAVPSGTMVDLEWAPPLEALAGLQTPLGQVLGAGLGVLMAWPSFFESSVLGPGDSMIR